LGLTAALDVTAAAEARIILTCMSSTTTNSSRSESGGVRVRCPRSAIAIAISESSGAVSIFHDGLYVLELMRP